jgi:large-conductance mechanosensitive channel
MSLFGDKTLIISNGIRDFFVKNNLLTTMASVSVGLVSSDFIKSFVSDIIFPFIVLLMRLTHIKILQIPLTKNTRFHFLKFFQSLVSLIISVLTTYYFITYLSKLVARQEKKEEKNIENK